VSFSCKEDTVYAKIQMEIKNVSSFEIQTLELKANSNNYRISLYKLENVKANETKLVDFDLSTFKQLQDGNYILSVSLKGSFSKETSFGYFTNNVDSKSNYIVEITNNDIVVK
jgi:hypothetical protein